MDDKTLAALKASIAKWDKNARIRNVDRAKIGPDDCALCHLFHEEYRTDDETSCFGCPVRNATGDLWCHGTPYVKASVARNCRQVPEFRKMAKEEAAFLRSLLPEGATA